MRLMDRIMKRQMRKAAKRLERMVESGVVEQMAGTALDAAGKIAKAIEEGEKKRGEGRAPTDAQKKQQADVEEFGG